MLPKATTRRRFLAAVGRGHGGRGYFRGRSRDAPCRGTSSPKKHAIRLGAPVFDAPPDPEGLALAHRKLGYRAAYCPGRRFERYGPHPRHRGGLCQARRGDCRSGTLVQPGGCRPAKRRRQPGRGDRRAGPGRGRRCRCCVDIAGSFSRASWFGPDPDNFSPRFFDAAVENARKIIDAVKPKRAKFCYEVMGWSLPDSADSYLKMIKAVDRKAFGVHLDPCNLINSPEKFYGITAVLNECFDKLGPWIVSCHAKDLTWDVEMNVHFREVCIGAGSMDYRTYLRRLAALAGDVPLMIEHMKDAAEYDKSRQHLFKVAGKIGVSFG